MSSDNSLTPLIIRVKRRADEEKTVPNKRCKFVATCDSPKDEVVYKLLTKTKSVPKIDDNNKIEIKDLDDWKLNKSNKKEVITCNGQPLESVENRLEDSFEYIYDIYLVDNKEKDDLENPNHYRECGDSEEDSNDENYAYNDYPDDNEVSEDVIDYYSYRDDDHNDSQHDMKDDFQPKRESSDYELSDEEVDEIERYFKKQNLSPNAHEEQEDEEYDEEEDD